MARTETEAVDSYVSDMLALEEHIAEVFGAQIQELGDKHPVVVRELGRCRSVVLNHIQALRKVRKVGDPHVTGRIAGAIKKAGTLAAGLGAGAIDLLRMERAAKALRDGYTAASLASIGYGMLYATAVLLNDEMVGFLAERHLREYASMTMSLLRLMPRTVLESLEERGLAVHDEALAGINRSLSAVWNPAADATPQPA
ncbi:MAG: hypothetical protein ABJC74_16885 [Gemmatimonadota bacterium]